MLYYFFLIFGIVTMPCYFPMSLNKQRIVASEFGYGKVTVYYVSYVDVHFKENNSARNSNLKMCKL